MLDVVLSPTILWPLALLVVLVGGFAVALRLQSGRFPVRRRLQQRFILGVPWGSVLTIGGLLICYAIVQRGLWSWSDPLWIPFVNWSYLYPTGVILGPFTHAGPGHLMSNLFSAALLAPLAEYIWGHYSEESRSADVRGILARPYVRAIIVFPAAVIGVGLLTSILAWGPVIGFSGVVFAFAGFVVVRYPLTTVITIVSTTVLSDLVSAASNPYVIEEVRTELTTPWWVGISIQGHLVGFLIGAVLGVILLTYRHENHRPGPIRLWFGLVLVMVMMSLWAIWFPAEGDQYILYRGAGMLLVLGLVAAITIATVTKSRPLVGAVTRRQLAIMGILLPILVIALVAIPMNTIAVTSYDRPPHAATAEDYTIQYGDTVPNPVEPGFTIPFWDPEPGTSSGVIVSSQDRQLWTEAISRNELARTGDDTIRVGGLTWSESINVSRIGWSPVGNESVYRVMVESDATSPTESYHSPSRLIEPVIANHSIRLNSTEAGFFIIVTGPNGDQTEAMVPDENETSEVGELQIDRSDGSLYAEYNSTRVPIAEQENTSN